MGDHLGRAGMVQREKLFAGSGSPIRGPAPPPRAGGGRERNALAGGQQRRLRPRYHPSTPRLASAPAQRHCGGNGRARSPRRTYGSAPAKDWNAMPAARSPPCLHLPGKTEVTALYPDAGRRHVGRHGQRHAPRGPRRRPAPARDEWLEVDRVDGLFEDRERVLWIATERGVFRLAERPASVLRRELPPWPSTGCWPCTRTAKATCGWAPIPAACTCCATRSSPPTPPATGSPATLCAVSSKAPMERCGSAPTGRG